MRGIFGCVVLIGTLAFVQAVAAQSGQAATDSRPLYAGPTAEVLASEAAGDARSGALPAVAGASSSPRASPREPAGEPGLMLASIDAQPFARADSRHSAELGPVNRYALRVLEVVNEYRQRNGLAPLRIAEDLGSLAQAHSVKMAERRRISHDGFRDRFNRTTSRICVENVGMNFPHPEAQVDGWRASPGHDRNLLEPRVTRVGIANNRSFVTFFACS